MKMIIFSLAAVASLTIPTALMAEPTAEEACDYFSRPMPIKGAKAPGMAFPAQEAELGDFVQTSLHLERYATIARPVFQPYAVPRNDGRVVVVGYISAVIACKIDVIDRRVIEFSVIDGPRVGGEVESPSGRTLVIQGVEEVTVEIGARAHRGQF